MDTLDRYLDLTGLLDPPTINTLATLFTHVNRPLTITSMARFNGVDIYHHDNHLYCVAHRPDRPGIATYHRALAFVEVADGCNLDDVRNVAIVASLSRRLWLVDADDLLHLQGVYGSCLNVVATTEAGVKV